MGADNDQETPLAESAELESSIRMVSAVPTVGEDFPMTGEQSQSVLFANDSLILPESVKQYTKAVAAIHAVPNAGMNATARRLMDACILVAQLYHRKLKPAEFEQMRDMRASPMFEVQTNYLRKLGGIRERNLSALEDNFELLRKTGFRWNVISEDSQIQFNMQSSFVTSWGIGRGKSAGWVRFALEPAVLQVILEPRMFAAFSLQVMDDLRTESSYQLFQAAFRYINTDAKTTPLLEVVTWIELIKGPCSYVQEDPKTKEKTVTNLHDFKRRDLIPAMERINAIDALNYALELVERKAGPKITHWRFKFVPKRQQTFRFDIPSTWPIEMRPLLQSIGFKDAELSDMAQGYSTQQIAEALRRLEEAERRFLEQGKRIYSRKSYLVVILENMDEQHKLDTKKAEELEAVARKKVEEEAALRRQQNMQERFSEHQAAVLERSLKGLAPEMRMGLLDAFKTYAEENLGQMERRLVTKDPEAKGRPVFLLLRKWLQEHRNNEWQELLPYPQDREFQEWVMWQADKPAP